MHTRFCTLVAPSITSRLQLAALAAATSTLVPLPGGQGTGAEQAVVLVRQVSMGEERAGVWAGIIEHWATLHGISDETRHTGGIWCAWLLQA